MSARKKALIDSAVLLAMVCFLVARMFTVEYFDNWGSIESTFIGDARILRDHLPHPAWQPLWYCGTRFDYIYPPALRYGTALLSLLAHVSTARAYHWYTGAFYALGIAGVYWLAWIGSRSRAQAWLAASLTAVFSPCFLLMSNLRHDSLYWVPQRLHVLASYGEGPHISALSVLGFALAASFAALRKWNPMLVALAGILCALVVANNFYGATALVLFFPMVAWAVWLETRRGVVWLRATGIAAIAYGLCAFWLTPSYIRITGINMKWVAEPAKPSSALVGALCIVIFGVVTFLISKRTAVAAWPVFLIGGAAFTSLYVLGSHYFGLVISGDANRLTPELDLALILFTSCCLVEIWKRRTFRPVAAAMVIAACIPAIIYVVHRRSPFPRAQDYRQRPEFQTTKWLAENLPGARSLSSGSIRYWNNAWYDIEEAYGGSNQGMINQILPHANFQITQGEKVDLAILWLQALGVDAVIVPSRNSLEIYHDYSHPEKFHGAAPELYNDNQGNIIYRIPRRYPGIARVVDGATLAAIPTPRAGDDRERLRSYVEAIEHGPDSPAEVALLNFEAFDIKATLSVGQALLVQETFDPAWRADSDGVRVPIDTDAMGFMLISAPPGAHTIHLRFERPLENTLGWGLTGLTVLAIGWLVFSRRPANHLS